jgi:hypothetical protein
MDTKKPLTVSLPTAARVLGVGKWGAYDQAREKGELTEGVPVIKVGGRYRVVVAKLEAAMGVELLPEQLLEDDDDIEEAV